MQVSKFLVAGFLLIAPLAASAATVTQQTGSIFAGDAGVLGGTAVKYTNLAAGGEMSGQAGGFQLVVNADLNGDKTALDRFIGFCITPFTYLQRSGTTLTGDFAVHQNIVADIKSLSIGKLNMLGALAKGAWTEMQKSAENAVAFQLAVWEIVAENNNSDPYLRTLNVYSDDKSKKNFFMKAPSKTLQATSIATANEWLSKLGTKGWEFGTEGLTVLTVASSGGHDVTQDIMTYTPPAPVPLPAAFGLLAAGLAAFAAIGRARRV